MSEKLSLYPPAGGYTPFYPARLALVPVPLGRDGRVRSLFTDF